MHTMAVLVLTVAMVCTVAIMVACTHLVLVVAAPPQLQRRLDPLEDWEEAQLHRTGHRCRRHRRRLVAGHRRGGRRRRLRRRRLGGFQDIHVGRR